ncbi:hypothetical protein BU25DRAFT_97919 [Macroventuria anomochaeta]|uniref:Uncharacterized protein n=1 Tax=Macroventuria anomochaeta TaxID=301207 RepID=A0ACB6RZ30_9PLEO|nr:uncharacterized protein BU25DRAFT_97919 [Macroventuria anomochaeta]KAF2626408.1 hypothetical protein BU25DRAFT_97919 [Macroventuria anomochaeta]
MLDTKDPQWMPLVIRWYFLFHQSFSFSPHYTIYTLVSSGTNIVHSHRSLVITLPAIAPTSWGGGFTRHQVRFQHLNDADSDLPKKAAQMRQRFFAQLLRTSLDGQEESLGESVLGTRIATERRILVNHRIAITLCVVFSVLFCRFIALLRFSRQRNRPLHLRRNPSSVLGLCSTIVQRTTVLHLFKSLDLASRRALKAHLATRTFATSSKELYGSATWLVCLHTSWHC